MSMRRLLVVMLGVAVVPVTLFAVMSRAGAPPKWEGCYSTQANQYGGYRPDAPKPERADYSADDAARTQAGMNTTASDVQRYEASDGQVDFYRTNSEGMAIEKVVVIKSGPYWVVQEATKSVPCPAKKLTPQAPEGPRQDPEADNS